MTMPCFCRCLVWTTSKTIVIMKAYWTLFFPLQPCTFFQEVFKQKYAILKDWVEQSHGDPTGDETMDPYSRYSTLMKTKQKVPHVPENHHFWKKWWKRNVESTKPSFLGCRLVLVCLSCDMNRNLFVSIAAFFHHLRKDDKFCNVSRWFSCDSI